MWISRNATTWTPHRVWPPGPGDRLSYPPRRSRVNTWADSQARCRELATEKVERRIARAVLCLVRQAGRCVEEGVRIRVPVSRQDIAEITGTTLNTVSRTLSAWDRKELVALGREQILIREPHASLVTIAEPLDGRSYEPS